MEQVDSALAAAGVAPGLDQEELAERGVDLAPLYARARREMRARCCLQIAGGWGLAGRLSGGDFDDGLDQVRHTLWFTTQYTFDPRFDLLGTAQLWNGFDDTHARVGAALMRKTSALDLTTETDPGGGPNRLRVRTLIRWSIAQGL